MRDHGIAVTFEPRAQPGHDDPYRTRTPQACAISCARSVRCSASARTPGVPEVELERALREVAVLVARGVAPEDVFAATSEQAARVCRVGAGAVVRFDRSGAVIVGRWGHDPARCCPRG